MQLDDRVSSGWFAVEKGLRQGCALPPLLLDIFFAVIINVAYTRFKAENALVHLRKKTGAGRRRDATVGEPVLETSLWGMPYADNVGAVSQSPEKLRKMLGVFVVACAAFGPTISEAKTEIMYVFAHEDDAVVHRHIQ